MAFCFSLACRIMPLSMQLTRLIRKFVILQVTCVGCCVMALLLGTPPHFRTNPCGYIAETCSEGSPPLSSQ